MEGIDLIETEESGLGDLAGKYLTFALSQEKYGIEILKVVEIINMMHVTSVPRSEDHIKGVINLRGKIIPVIDLRLKFDLPPRPYDELTCIIVVNVLLQDQKTALGMIVDTVLEVTDFEQSELSLAPEYGDTLDTKFVLALAKRLERDVVIISDIDRIFSDIDPEMIAEIEKTAAE